MVEVFDAHKVSFVSITQSFNTTTSMGRLTLNVLLSFAQFEREVTGERIRDKIAASKKKGMWMGGNIPLGYDLKERKLFINEGEAKTVRTIFELYAELESIKKLKAECDRLRLRTKARAEGKGSIAFGIGHLHHILTNPLYAGFIKHKGQIHVGDHAAIIPQELWDIVQQRLAAGAYARRSGSNAKEASLLVGLMFDGDGNRMTPSHAVKNGKRYRYYLSNNLNCGKGEGIRVPAHEIEGLVIDQVMTMLKDSNQLIDILGLDGESPSHITGLLKNAAALAGQLREGMTTSRRPILQDIIRRIIITGTGINIEITRTGLRKLLDLPISDVEDVYPYILETRTELRRLGGEKKLVIATQPSQTTDPYLVKAIVRAHRWFEMLKTHHVKSVAEIAEQENIPRNYISSLLPLAFLAPNITEAILDGQQPADLRLDKLLKLGQTHMRWKAQNSSLKKL